MKIVKLESENIKRIKAVEIQPDGSMVVIGGRNGQGKTSILDSIEYALAGKDSIPVRPIRKGQEKARVVVDLGNLIVKRIFTSGGSRLEVSNKDGSFYKSPQAILDDLSGKLSFDPLEFVKTDPKKQVEMLRSLVGLDFSSLDAEREKIYSERTGINRDLKACQVKLAAIPMQEAPKEEVSVALLAQELERRMKANQENQKKRGQASRMEEAILVKESQFDRLENQIIKLQEQIKELREKADSLRKEISVAASDREQLLEEIENLHDFPLDEVRSQIANAEQINVKVRQNKQRMKLEKEMEEVDQKAMALSKAIEAIDETKASLLSSAHFPVEGLSFDETGVTFNGIPFEQCSSSEQLRVSAAIGFSMNPKLRVLLIRDGSLLDEENLKLLSEMAVQNDGQIWLEVVREDGNCAVVIEDGQVRGKKQANNQQEVAA